MAHEIPYVATATIADLHDLEAKIERAMGLRGARYVHVLVTCPLGWGTRACDSVRIARLAVESRPVPGVRGRARRRHGRPRRSAVACPWRSTCGRSGATPTSSTPTSADDVLDRIQARADRNITRFGLLPQEEDP